MTSQKSFVLTLSILALGNACSDSSDNSIDGRNDSFGAGKTDGRYTDCQLTETVNFVREPTTTQSVLVNTVGLHPNAANEITALQNGPDGIRGTADDALVENLSELDSVPFIGIVALDALVGTVVSRCETDLGDPDDTSTAERPYISKRSFDGTSGGGWTRDAVEMEATFAVHGVSGPELNEVLSDTNSRGRSRFRRIVNDLEDVFGALTYGDHPYTSNWNSSANDLRETVKYVALTIEPGRKQADNDDKWFAAETGTDKMEDHYFSTFGGALQRIGMLVRARRRIDGDPLDFTDPCDTPMRRVLIQTKFKPTIDEDGVKRGGKVDTRSSANTLCDTKTTEVVETAMWGQSDWDGALSALEPIRVVYDALAEVGALANIGSHEGVLLLNPTVALWSERSRFHYDLATTRDIRSWFDNGTDAISRIVEEARDSQSPFLTSVITAGEALLDRSAIVAKVNQLNPGISLSLSDIEFPTEWSSQDSRERLATNKLVAEAIEQAFGDFDDLVDEVNMHEIVSQVEEAGSDRRVLPFMAYKRDTDSSVAGQRAAISFWELFKADDANQSAGISSFESFCQEQVSAGDDFYEDCEDLSTRQWQSIGRHLHADMITHSRRMVEAAGTSSHALWFHSFRDHYFGNVSNWGNFMIVTFDWTQAISERIWEKLSPVDRYHGIPAENVFWTTFVQENQVELTAEGPQKALEKKEELQAVITDGTATEEEKEIYSAATFVLDTYLATEVALAEASGPTIVGDLRRRVQSPDGNGTDTNHEFSNNDSSNIPDNEPAGIESSITVSDNFEISGLEVTIDISHSFIADLRVTLERGNTVVVLHNLDGGNANSLVRSYVVDDFNGEDAKGDWILRVSDNANADTGLLKRVDLNFLSSSSKNSGGLRWAPALGSKGGQALEKMTSGNLE